MKRLLVGLVVGLLLGGCAKSYHINYPLPFHPIRPQIHFVDSQDDEMKQWLCLTPQDTRDLMNYVLQLEMELDKASVTLKEINK